MDKSSPITELSAIKKTKDGGFVFLGMKSHYDALLKIDAQGNQKWQKELKVGFNDLNMGQTSSDEMIFTGRNGGKCGVVKTDASGNVLWNKIYGDNNACQNSAQTSDGGYLVAGHNFGSASIFLLKLNQAGEVLWEKTYPTKAAFKRITALIVSADGSALIGGVESATNYLRCNDIVLKVDAWGNQIWRKTYRSDNANSVYLSQPFSDNSFYLIGKSASQSNVKYVIKCDEQGKQIFQRTLSNAFSNDTLRGVRLPNDQFMVAGWRIMGNGTSGFGIGEIDYKEVIRF